MLKVFVGRKLRDQLTPTECADLVADFKRYKNNGELPITFGRDAPYDHPHTPPAVLAEALKHIHLYDPEAPWPTYL